MNNYSKEKNESVNFQELVGNFNNETSYNDFSLFPNQFNYNYLSCFSQLSSSQEYFNNIDNNDLSMISPLIDNGINHTNFQNNIYSSPLDNSNFNPRFSIEEYLYNSQVINNNQVSNDITISDFNLYESYYQTPIYASTPLISNPSFHYSALLSDFNNKNKDNTEIVVQKKLNKFVEYVNMENLSPPIKEKKKVGRKKNKQTDFKCEKCGKLFKRAFNLKVHLETHDEIRYRNHSCFKCNRKFTRKHDLTRHIINVHNLKP